MTAPYVPPPGDWARIDPRHAGFDPGRLEAALEFARGADSPWPRSMFMPDGTFAIAAQMGEPLPWGEPLGVIMPRHGPNGMILRGGRLVASWGEIERPEMTYSVAKSYLALLAGLAVGRGLIGDLDDPVRLAAPDPGYDSDRNRGVTWRHLLQQTSEWEGTLFDRPDMVDRNRQVGAGAVQTGKGTFRKLGPPGSFWEYNDIRVNRLALSLMQVFGEELPDVLKREIMDPIGASPSWRWHGYVNSMVTVKGRPMVSVPGGSHWGGGIVISSPDHARLGLLVAREGKWGERQILPAGWAGRLRESPPQHKGYGLMWWLNTDRVQYPSAPASSLFAMGAGNHLIWIDPDHDLVAVIRWVDGAKADALLGKILAAMG
ncbi:MAG: serine hydrolase [Alphaproteobacteria bacterium]|nr:serine hydrolase [Alphaproteobacteria bacterium]